MRIKVEVNLDAYEWDGRTLHIQFLPPDEYASDEPDPEELPTEEAEKKLKVIGKK